MTNIYLCISSIYRLRFSKKPCSFEEEKDNIRELVLNEKVEFVTPIAYLLCFLTAYFGPNAEILGTVKFGAWHYSIVDDVGKLMGNMAVLFIIDFLSGVISGILLMIFCKINIFTILLELQKEFWLYMAVLEQWLLVEVSHFILHLFTLIMYNSLILL